ncbi:MAG: AraC family transcriptional regulator [Acutalibacteraceae bacterium]
MQKVKAPSKWTSSQLMTNKNYEINFYSDKDFKAVSLHSHDFYELYFFVSGNASYIIENGHYALHSGDILMISPQNLHQLDINDSRETYERVVLWLNPKYVKTLSSAASDLSECFALCDERKDFLLRDAEVSATVKDLLFSLYSKSNSEEFGSDIECENIIRDVLLVISRYLRKSTRSAASDGMQNRLAASPVTKILRYVDEHLGDDLTLDNIAENVFLNKFYIARLFKKETNSTLHQYILKKRLLQSKKLIENNVPIAEVCTKCGFNDYSHFFRAFKSEYGITPKQYHSLISSP